MKTVLSALVVVMLMASCGNNNNAPTERDVNDPARDPAAMDRATDTFNRSADTSQLRNSTDTVNQNLR